MSFISDISDYFNKFKRIKLLPPKQNLQQYDYDDLLKYINYPSIKEEYYKQLDILYDEQKHYYPSEVHGIDHTARVILMADLLCNLDKLDNHTKDLILLAARYHDIGRYDESESKDHGALGAKKVQELGLLNHLSKEDQDIIKFAITQHSLSREENEKAISKLPFWKCKKYETVLSYLKDADALDRVRIANKNMQLDPNRLRNNTAKHLVDFSKYYFFDYYMHEEEYINYRNSKKMSPELKEIYDYISRFIKDKNFVFDNHGMLEELYRRGVIQDLKATNFRFLSFIENEEYVSASTQIEKDDFSSLRSMGYNITYETFLNIVSQYKEGTLEILRNKGHLEEIFSRDTYEKYGKENYFFDKIEKRTIKSDELYSIVNKNYIDTLNRESFDNNYMLYKDLYENHSDRFKLLTYDGGINSKIASISGILSVFKENDLDTINENGYHFKARDIIDLCSSITPEKYRSIINKGNAKRLFSYELSEDAENKELFTENFNKIKSVFPNIKKKDFSTNYKLYKDVLSNIDLLKEAKGIEKYSIIQIYQALKRLVDAQKRLSLIKNGNIIFTGKDLLSLLEFSERTSLLNYNNEEERDKLIAFLTENKEWQNHPTFVNYITKSNKTYLIETPNDIIDYNRFCIEKILSDDQIDFEEAKSKLINSLFRIDIPDDEYHKEHEQNIIEELYYYMKYRKQDKIKLSEDEIEMEQAITDLIYILDSVPTIQDFKKALSEKGESLYNIQFDVVWQRVKDRMRDFSQNDIISSLQKTEQLISEAPTKEIVSENGERIPVRILNNQDFTLAITTVMPNCSGVIDEFNMDKAQIEDNMLNRPLNKMNRCTSLINQDMVANAMSAVQDNELRYGYVPVKTSQISIMGIHDLSSGGIRNSRKGHRTTKRSVQNRSAVDMILGTTEEHNESVLNKVLPRYIVCFDKISNISVKKFENLKKRFKSKIFKKPLEMLFIDIKNEYLPRIQENLLLHRNEINDEIARTGTISESLYQKYLNRHERNITLETVQAVNSTSYRDDTWDSESNKKNFSELANLLGEVIRVCPREYLGDIKAQVDFVLNPNYTYCDHSYYDDINRAKFVNLKKDILKRLNIDTDEKNKKNKDEEKDREKY